MKQRDPEMALSMKIVHVAVAIVCILLGIVGLIMPVMPGLLFLVIALLLLSRVSRRLRNWSHRQPSVQTLRERMARFSSVSRFDRFKLVGWMSLEVFVKGIAGAIESGKTLISVVRQP